MKLQVSFDFTDLDKAILIAKEISKYADIIEIGSTLIYLHGINAIKMFKENIQGKEIFADIKLVDRVEPIINAYCNAGAKSLSVLAGTSNNIIQNATKIAHDKNSYIALDFVDSPSLGQSAMDTDLLDVDRIIFHGPYELYNLEFLLEEWESISGNTKTPIFIAGGINKENINKILSLKPAGIIIGEAITKSQNPAKAAEFFKNLI